MFMKSYKKLHVPVKIKNCLDHWPALDDWNLQYFQKVLGYRTVPVEIGKRYTDDSWTQTLMTVNEFIAKYIVDGNEQPSIGYLAQHELFQQIPELKDDFDIPLYCYSDDNEEEASVNIWFGPSDTVSPLHTDPKHNCLCQVFGQKYVRLYSDENQMYPFEDLLSNTSKIDLEKDYQDIIETYPEFKHAKGLETILEPGDLLYIPPKCWHFVKSLSTSCSLSFWFE